MPLKAQGLQSLGLQVQGIHRGIVEGFEFRCAEFPIIACYVLPAQFPGGFGPSCVGFGQECDLRLGGFVGDLQLIGANMIAFDVKLIQAGGDEGLGFGEVFYAELGAFEIVC